MFHDYYEILGVPENASEEEIKKKFRELAKKYHPDVGGDPEKFKKILEAYRILSNKKSRQEYDLKRKFYAESNKQSKQYTTTTNYQNAQNNYDENNKTQSNKILFLSSGHKKKIIAGVMAFLLLSLGRVIYINFMKKVANNLFEEKSSIQIPPDIFSKINERLNFLTTSLTTSETIISSEKSTKGSIFSKQNNELQKRKEEIQRNLIYSFVGGNQKSLGAAYTYQTLKMWEGFGGNVTFKDLYIYLEKMFRLGLEFYSKLYTENRLPPQVTPEEATYYSLGKWITRIYSPTVIDMFGLRLPELSNINIILLQLRKKYQRTQSPEDYENYLYAYNIKVFLEHIYNGYKSIGEQVPIWLERAVKGNDIKELYFDYLEQIIKSKGR